MPEMLEVRGKAELALNKPSPYGPDLDLSSYSRIDRGGVGDSSGSAPLQVIAEQAARVGVYLEGSARAGAYLQSDGSVVMGAVEEAYRDSLEVMSTREALSKHPWLRKYWWGVVPVDLDKYTALAELEWDQGYFIRVLPGSRVTLPIQSCFLISRDNLDQNVHNLVILEAGSEAQLITGCTVHPNVRRGLHVGVSEFILREGSKLVFTMIHGWAEGMDVRPRTGVVVEDGATFISNYVCTSPVRSLQTYPVAYCVGEGSRASFNTLIYGVGKAVVDVGSRIHLRGRGSRGEMVTRAIAAGESRIYTRGMLVGEDPESRGHLECRGLLLSDKAMLHAIPELVGEAQGTELSHEAAVGKISEDQIEYLMARGLSEEEATSLIVKGFLDVEILGLSGALREEVQRIIDATTSRAI
ncbi:MAG: SufD family Fe-S cluster assembly protein [Candidatus Bathyarchaeia archaeon]